MIVVDTDVIAAFWIAVERTPQAIRVRRKDLTWAAPVLWRSEFRSVLRQYMRAGYMSYSEAIIIAGKAEANMRGREYTVDTRRVLSLVEQTGHSAYDCEFVALARLLGARLVTGDRRISRLFPTVAVLMEEFAE